MKKFVKKLHLKAKLILFISVLLISIVFVQSFLSYQSLSTAYDTIAASTQESLDTLIKTEVQSVIGVLTENYDRYKNGEITEQVALENAKKIVRDTRYNNGSGYFWADMADGKCVVHTNADYQGQMRIDNKDTKGNYYIRNLIAAGNKGGGFTDFWFTKLNTSGEFQKRAYTQKFEPYGWYISTGNYQVDMTPLIQAKLDQCNRNKTLAMLTLIISSILFIILGIVILFIIANSITKPLNLIIKRLEQLSAGDLHTPVPIIDQEDETGILAKTAQITVSNLHATIDDITKHLSKMAAGDFNTAVTYDYVQDFEPIGKSIQQVSDSLNKFITAIDESSEQVSNGSSQVSDGAQALAHGATEQASSIEQLSASIGEISASVKGSAANAANASTKVNQVSADLQESNQHMQEMIAAMSRISTSSNEIGKIIKTIEDIAFQTNILALNAAVEAARAGSAGKGFAVVADEVRNLASKSAQAAKNTTSLIQNSISEVANGTKIADTTASALLKVVEAAESVANTVDQIAQTSNEQANVINQVTLGVEQISAVVQTNSATSEESAAASEELSSQAHVLKELVGKFKLKNKTSQNQNNQSKSYQENPGKLASDSKY